MASKLNASETGAGIRTKFNALVDIVMGISSEKIPVSALQDGNLSNSQFETLSDGTIGIKTSYLQTLGLGGGTGTVTPPAPTNPIIDDTADTFKVTPPTGYTSAQLETSVNSGSTWSDNPSLNGAFYIGDFSKVVGQVITRVKASGSYGSGVGVSNTTAFTVSAGTGGLTSATQAFWDTKNTDWVFSGGTVTYNGADDYQTTWSGDKYKIPAGGTFIVQMASGVNESARLGVVTTQQGSVNGATAAVFYGGSSTNGRFTGVISGDGRDSYSNVNITGSLLGRIRGDGTTIFLEQSVNSGTSWQLITSDSTTPQPNAVLYVEGINIQSGGVSNYLNDVKYSGLVPA